jgi:hypothetical protein
MTIKEPVIFGDRLFFEEKQIAQKPSMWGKEEEIKEREKEKEKGDEDDLNSTAENAKRQREMQKKR